MSNLAKVFKSLRAHEHISRAEIAVSLGLNPSTVSRLVDELIGVGIVHEGEEYGPSTDRGGRRAVELKLNPDAGYLVGVDLGGATVMGGVANLKGEILTRRCGPLKSVLGQGGDQTVERLIELTRELIEAAPVPSRVWGIGVGAPSWTLPEQGVVTWAPALGWRDLPLKQIMQDALRLPVFVENDVNLAALGERWCGAGQGAENLVVVFVGTGIGAGIVVMGQLYRGASCAAGEVGYMLVDVEHLDRRYDEFGCLEMLASGAGMAASLRHRTRAGETSSLADQDLEAVSAEQIFEAARGGDSLAQSVVDETIRYLSLAIANVACILNPEMIIIGGGIAQSAEVLIEGIRHRLDGVVPVVPRLAVSTLGKEAVVKGAYALILHELCEANWLIPLRRKE